MKRYDEEDEVVNRLAEEIGQYGEPYTSDEPDAVYWANFRVRVMDEVERQEAVKARGFLGSIGEMLFGSPLRWASSLAGVAAVVIAVVTLGPSAPDGPKLADQKLASQQAVQTAVSPVPSVASPAVPDLGHAIPGGILAGTGTPHKEPVANEHVAIEATTEKSIADATAETEVDGVEGANAVLAELAMDDPDQMTQSTHLDAADAPVSLSDLSAPELESVLKELEKD